MSGNSHNSINVQSPYHQNAFKGIANPDQATAASGGLLQNGVHYSLLDQAPRNSVHPFGTNSRQSQAS